MSAQSIQSIKDQMTAMEQSLSQMRLALEALTVGSAAVVEPSAKPSAKAPKAEPKEPKAPTAWNMLVQSTVADMRQNGWESWTDAKGTVWPASRRGAVKDKSGAESEGFVYDGGEHDGKAPSPAMGGMLRASYLKSAAAPYATVAPSATASAEPKKAGRPPMTAEQKAAAAAKREAKKASAEQSGSDSAAEADKPKKAGRPPMTAEQKAAAAAKRAAKKASAPHSDAESVQTCSAMPEGWAELLGEKIAPKKVDLSFYPFVYEGQSLIMNDRGDVVDPEEGVWVGRLNRGILDKTVSEPADLVEVEMRE
jgi:hypothetical protein